MCAQACNYMQPHMHSKCMIVDYVLLYSMWTDFPEEEVLNSGSTNPSTPTSSSSASASAQHFRTVVVKGS